MHPEPQPPNAMQALLNLEVEHNPSRAEPADPRDPRHVRRDDPPEIKGRGWWS